MIYLVIMFLVAATGVASLWVQQKRERAHLETVDGFKDSLERLSAAPLVRSRQRTASAARKSAPARRHAPSGGHPRGRHAPMDPARRAAARKRIEARRRAAATRSRAR